MMYLAKLKPHCMRSQLNESKMNTLYQKVSTKEEDPIMENWYWTDEGRLYFHNGVFQYNEEDDEEEEYTGWSCREDTVSEEYPSVWFKPLRQSGERFFIINYTGGDGYSSKLTGCFYKKTNGEFPSLQELTEQITQMGKKHIENYKGHPTGIQEITLSDYIDCCRSSKDK